MKNFLIVLFLILGSIYLYAEEQTPVTSQRYFIKISLQVSNASLNIWTHIRNSANASQLIIPVDKEFYDSIQVGDVLNEDFKAGSFFIGGSMGSWDIRVLEKSDKPFDLVDSDQDRVFNILFTLYPENAANGKTFQRIETLYGRYGGETAKKMIGKTYGYDFGNGNKGKVIVTRIKNHEAKAVKEKRGSWPSEYFWMMSSIRNHDKIQCDFKKYPENAQLKTQ